MSIATIICGKCHGRHATSAEVRACYFPPRPSAHPAPVAAVAQSAPPVAQRQSHKGVIHVTAEVTVAQLNKVRSLGGDVVHAAKLNRGDASAYIDRLIRSKESPVTEQPVEQASKTIIPLDMILNAPEGYFGARQDENTDYDYFRISRPKSGQYKGAVKIQTQHSDLLKEVMVLWPSGRLSVYKRSIENNLLLVLLDPRGTGQNYGRTIGRCQKCGKTLTDGRSRWYGIGPDCEERFPEVIDEVNDMFGLWHPGLGE